MIEIRTEILINASLQAIWQVLTDFSGYSGWNDFLGISVDKLEMGGELEVAISPAGGRPINYKPRLIALDETKELRWRGEFVAKALFQCEHYFLLEQLSDNQVRFIQGERFTGLMIPLFRLLGFANKTEQGFEHFNQAIKQKVELLKA